MKVAAAVVIAIAIIVGWIALITWILMLAWNAVMPSVFGLSSVTFWQALALMVVVHILLGFVRAVFVRK